MQAFIGSSLKNDADGSDEGDQESDHGRQLQSVVYGSKRPMVLRGKYEMNE